MTDRKIPFGVTLAAVTGVCAAFWLLTLLFPRYVGAAALIIATCCLVIQFIVLVRQAFTFGSHNLADFVAGKAKRKPVENPLMRDPFYASVAAQIEEAKVKHKPIKHLYAKREHRVRELLGTKGVAQ